MLHLTGIWAPAGCVAVAAALRGSEEEAGREQSQGSLPFLSYVILDRSLNDWAPRSFCVTAQVKKRLKRIIELLGRLSEFNARKRPPRVRPTASGSRYLAQPWRHDRYSAANSFSTSASEHWNAHVPVSAGHWNVIGRKYLHFCSFYFLFL